MLHCTIHANTSCMIGMPTMVHFLNCFHNCNPRLRTMLVTLFWNPTLEWMQEMQTSLNHVEAKSQKWHNKNKQNDGSQQSSHNAQVFSSKSQNTTAAMSENKQTEVVRAHSSGNSVTRFNLMHLTQQLHSRKVRKSLLDPFADVYSTDWFYYHNQYGDYAHTCK